jgi:hypothetical protein
MNRVLDSWTIRDIVDKIKLNPATLETLPDTQIKVNIEYQRGLVYSAEKQASVIESILKDFAIPSIVLWWNTDDDTYDVIDGKQRLTSIFLFVKNNLQINYFGNKKYFSEITEADKQTIMDYDVPFIIMSGTADEEHFKHELFEILNITAEKLNPWELLQGSYYGNFLNTFKQEIQNPRNHEIQPGFNIRDKRQPATARYEGLYKLLNFHFGSNKDIKEYISNHREESGSDYYINTMKPILQECSRLPEAKNIDIYYPTIRKILNDINIHTKYTNKFNDIVSDLKEFYRRNAFLKYTGNDYRRIVDNIFGLHCEYVVKDAQRTFNAQQKDDLFNRVDSKNHIGNDKVVCQKCGKIEDYHNMQVDHVIPWSYGGPTTLENAQFLCASCNASKNNN